MSDEEYEYDYGSDGDEDEDDDAGAIEIENAFYEGDDCKVEDPGRALEMFNRVISLTEDDDEGENLKWRFRALENIVILHGVLGDAEQMLARYRQMMEYISMVTRNECTDSINKVLDSVSNNTSLANLQSVYEITLQALKNANNERLWLNTNIKLGRVHLEAKNYSRVAEIARELQEACRLPDGTDDLPKGSYLLEAYALEIQLCTQTHNTSRMKEIYPKTEALNAAVADPRIMGIIREEGGKMFMGLGSWSEAYNEFYAAFRNYQEGGNPRAKTCLKYVVLSNMLALSDINPFAAREAKVFQDDREIMAMMDLRMAYESSDMQGFDRILQNKSNKILEDEYLKMFVERLRNRMRESVLLAMVKPYVRIEMRSVAQELNIESDAVEKIVVNLILDGRVKGRIDQVHGCIILDKGTEAQTVGKEYEGLRGWCKALHDFNEHICAKVQ
uniref:PCI domain-containing protein n=1 Tax=Pinguiococcus pyrenoidosus TaxID=172671 RepID=A0A7R9YB37_9STRA|mmetsp:Transcript_16102/g.61439  ORF Transcript_16102/g.61439 Transcript_16102/m.61439 type:complete len:446 (+) Transcript_16102:81-1418(+)